MSELKQIKPRPGVVGIVVTVLLLVSRYLGAASTTALESLNTVLVVIALILSLHLVRRTSALYQPHVWNSAFTFVLFLFPLLNLLAAGLQLLLKNAAFLNSKPVLAALILVSVPVFFCVYFIYISGKLPNSRSMFVFSRILASVGAVYMLLRLLDTVLFPLLADRAGLQIPPALLRVAGWNTHISFLIYLMSFAGFILLHNELKPRQGPAAQE